jgi:hypothetical protein
MRFGIIFLLAFSSAALASEKADFYETPLDVARVLAALKYEIAVSAPRCRPRLPTRDPESLLDSATDL